MTSLMAVITTAIDSDLVKIANLDYLDVPPPRPEVETRHPATKTSTSHHLPQKEMKDAAKNLDFERAAETATR
ncbi:MAG: hypothetical protein ACXW5U_14285 [Thermoanaerobaculia bacterium]